MAAAKGTKMANRFGLDIVISEIGGDGDTIEVEFANISNIDISGDAVWATAGQGRTNVIGYNNPITGSFTLSTQIQTMELLGLAAGSKADEDNGDITVVFENTEDTAVPTYYTITGTTVWQDADGVVYNETLTFHKAKPNRAYSIAYDGGGDPVSVDIGFDLSENSSGYILTIARV